MWCLAVKFFLAGLFPSVVGAWACPVFPVRCSHVGLWGLGSWKTGYRGYEEQRNGWILSTFLKLLVPPAVWFEKMFELENGEVQSLLTLFASGYQLRLTSKQFSQQSTMRRVNFQRTEIFDSLSLLSQHDSAQQLQSEAMWNRQAGLLFFNNRLPSDQKKDRAQYLKPQVLLQSQDAFRIMWFDLIMLYSVAV